MSMEAYMYGLEAKSEHWDITCTGMRGISGLSTQWEAIKDGESRKDRATNLTGRSGVFRGSGLLSKDKHLVQGMPIPDLVNEE
jgi:hypothetical protein